LPFSRLVCASDVSVVVFGVSGLRVDGRMAGCSSVGLDAR